MNRIRVATEAEVEAIRETSDIDSGCLVVALDTQAGTAKAVLRTCVEVDPVHYPDTMSPKIRMLFMRDIETYLSGKGVSHYYFNIHSDKTEFIESMKGWGAEVLSKVPEVRLKKIL